MSVLKDYAAHLVGEVERCRFVAEYHRDPAQSASAERVAWRYLRKAEAVCEAIRVVRLFS